MLVQTTLDTLNQLKLYGMAAALTEQLTQSAASHLAFEERLGLIVDREVLHRFYWAPFIAIGAGLQ